MSTATRWTLIGMQAYETTLFDTLELPEGYDKQTFIDSLLLEHGEKCVLYTDPDFMKYSIGIWSRKWRLELTRIYEALVAEYNPLYNYDRFEEITDKEGHTLNRSETGNVKSTDAPDYTTTTNGTNTATTNTSNSQTSNNSTNQTTDNERDRVTEHTISADNSSSYAPDWKETTNDGRTKQTTSGNSSTNDEGTQSVNGSDSTISRINGRTSDFNEDSTHSTSDTENRENEHVAHVWGNIGVTTSTQMISDVVKQRMSKNLYDLSTRLFANELLIPIY